MEASLEPAEPESVPPVLPPATPPPENVLPPDHQRRLAARGLHGDERQHFRWRGEGVSRLENFSDVVFAFALTLLVVSNEVPHTFAALLEVLHGFPAFACTFILLLSFWYNHYLFFRRYGLHDTLTIVMNNFLLLLVLFCVYPVKFLASLLNASLLPWPTSAAPAGVPAVALYTMHNSDLAVLMRIYTAALASIFLMYALLYGRAWKLRALLELNRAEQLATVRMICGYSLTILFCAFSSLLTLRPATLGWSGLIFLFLIPALIANASIFRRRVRRAALYPPAAAAAAAAEV